MNINTKTSLEHFRNLQFPQIPHDNAFNAIRLFCCLIVIILHSLVLSQTNTGVNFLFDAHTAVCVFFILSGFWVTKSLLTSSDIKTYFKKRAKRILPLYYTVVWGGGIAVGICWKTSAK